MFSTMKRYKTLVTLCMLVTCLAGDAHGTYPSYPKEDFLPAKPGETPPCADDPRLTFCLETEKYPKDRILYLIKNKMFDVDTMLQDETRDTYTFEARDGPSYPATMMYDTPSPRPTNGYGKPRAVFPPMSGNGYNRPPKRINFNNRPLRNISSPYPAPKYDSYNHFKVPSYHPPYRNSTPPLNSFTSFPSKFDISRQSNYYNRNRFNAGRNRYRKGGYRPPVSFPPRRQNHWWNKNSRRRQKRQANLDDLCPARANYIMPRAAQSVGGDWMFLVNVDEQYTQLVKSETCIRNTCEGSCDAPDGFLAVCQQQYVQKRLVALDGSGSKLNSDTFWFPSCCLCKIRPGAG